jgi:hypothetical protein
MLLVAAYWLTLQDSPLQYLSLIFSLADHCLWILYNYQLNYWLKRIK